MNDDKKALFILEDKLKIKDYEIWSKNEIRIYERLDDINIINKTMMMSGIEVFEICAKVDNLEDYFLKLIGKENQVND